jgi:predicted amidohydrolase
VGNLTQVEKADTQYVQSGIFSPSDFTFPKDGIVGECSPNIETVVVGEIDLKILRRHRAAGAVTPLKDRRKDLYSLTFKKSVLIKP